MPWAPRWQLKSSENTAFYCGGVPPERAAGSSLSAEIQERESMTFQSLRWTQCQIEVCENFNFLLWVWGIGWMKREKEEKKTQQQALKKKRYLSEGWLGWFDHFPHCSLLIHVLHSRWAWVSEGMRIASLPYRWARSSFCVWEDPLNFLLKIYKISTFPPHMNACCWAKLHYLLIWMTSSGLKQRKLILL